MDVQDVLEFFRKNGFSRAEFALMEDIREKGQIGSFDFEKFLFPVDPPLPPVKVRASLCHWRVEGSNRDGRSSSSSWSGGDCSENDEFLSLGSSSYGVCSSELIDPYESCSSIQVDSDTYSDSISQFGSARDHHNFEMQSDLWYDEKDESYYSTPIGAFDPLGGGLSEDKFVMAVATVKQSKIRFGFNRICEACLPEKNFHHIEDPCDNDNYGQVKDYHHLDNKTIHSDLVVECDLDVPTDYCNSDLHGEDSIDFKEAFLNECQLKIMGEPPYEKPYSNGIEKRLSICSNGKGSAKTLPIHEATYVAAEDYLQDKSCDCEVGDNVEAVKGSREPIASVDAEESAAVEEFPFWETTEDEYDIFNLRVIHRKNRTGFEESKDLPIVLNSVVAGRYYIKEYIGSAAFSTVVHAHDIHMGVEVCLKIIKNDKDFFDQSLDEIKLLKFVNEHDPADEKHILRLYDYYYHQEHLFIVCELLQANLYEFQKYNLESGEDHYFTMSRLQEITRQCLEALDFLHQLGIIHCDLKPENILIKSYSRCEIKVIDLGSSCFETDDLCLYIQSRSYRAPEVILGLPYGPKIDIWSLGCILAELCSGEVLFPNDAVVLLLARMIGLFGPIDLEMLLRGNETYKYFTREYDLFHIHEDTNQVEYIVPESSSLEHQLPVSDVEFIGFLKYLLQLNPRRRPTAKEALTHPWLSQLY
ncbi:hypothetical protein Nepgr_029001 [Nepenthes gracilis]|uniref:Protein kinase domain-containing protein n=1 Tax=Nepenthes gracilis TaxID=150966 RepID=A0AAD3TDF5_NEPGR|nr:hypothetical protein Nepgr_029001 [Nepenthes gracilis]